VTRLHLRISQLAAGETRRFLGLSLVLIGVALLPAALDAADVEGRWTTGRKNVFVLHQQGDKITGVIEGAPGERTYKIVDGEIRGDRISFFVLHDGKDDPEVVENGGRPFRNTAQGTIAGDEITIEGAREGTGQRPYKLVLKRLRGE
jgi:hypothetical protein